MSASAIMGGFAARQRAAEGQYFNTEGNQAVMRHLEKLVQQVGGPALAPSLPHPHTDLKSACARCTH